MLTWVVLGLRVGLRTQYFKRGQIPFLEEHGLLSVGPTNERCRVVKVVGQAVGDR